MHCLVLTFHSWKVIISLSNECHIFTVFSLTEFLHIFTIISLTELLQSESYQVKSEANKECHEAGPEEIDQLQ